MLKEEHEILGYKNSHLFQPEVKIDLAAHEGHTLQMRKSGITSVSQFWAVDPIFMK